jgi:hypothetical protein
LSDTVTLKVSKRKIYLAIALIIILAVVGVGGFLAYRMFTSPSLHIDSFTIQNEPNLGFYNNASSWGQTWLLSYKFTNGGGGAADSVKLVYAFYDSRGLIENYTKDYGAVNANIQVTDSATLWVFSTMNIVQPAWFKIFLYEGNTLTDQSSLPYD